MFNIPTCNWSHQEPSLAYVVSYLGSTFSLQACQHHNLPVYFPCAFWELGLCTPFPACRSPELNSIVFAYVCIYIVISFTVGSGNNGSAGCRLSQHCWCAFPLWWLYSLPGFFAFSVVCHFGFLMSLVSHFVEIQQFLLRCTSHSVTVAQVSTSTICPTLKGTEVLQQW